MAYLPKSKITIKTSKVGELVYKINSSPFNGQYIESSNGKFYAGTNNLFLGKELKYSPRVALLDGYSNADKSIDVQIHNLLKPTTNTFTLNTSSIISSKPLPKEKDYQKGYYPRYFTKKINDFNYKEINKDVYNSILKRSGKYDHYINEIGTLNWHLMGNVFKKNTTSIKITTRSFPNIKNLFPIINEFYREDLIPTLQNNLHTIGKELYYDDGKEYIGLYHIHPEKGPMIGAQHTSLNHAKLYYSNQLPNIMDSKYQNFINSLNKPTDDLLIINKRPVNSKTPTEVKVKQQQPPTTTPPSTGGGSFGGGGGGY